MKSESGALQETPPDAKMAMPSALSLGSHCSTQDALIPASNPGEPGLETTE